jgi:Domain of unknown function (DUF4124)
MNRSGTLLMALATMAACGAFAQVYKSIGPDGKTIYSDSPPPPDSKSSTLISKPASPPSPAADPAKPSDDAPVKPPAKTMAEKKAAAIRGTRVDPARIESPATAATQRTEALDRAVVTVLGMENSITRAEEVCQRSLSAGWRERNAKLVAKAQLVFAEAYNAQEREIIQSGVSAKTQEMLAPVVKASDRARKKWCDQSANEINGGSLDPNNKDNISLPLINYRPKSG